ncbi:unnamed protein product, partial [Cyprideis torosa]
MTLAVFGKEDLDELESEVLKHFSKIVNKNVEKPSWPEHPYGPNEVGKILEIVPVRETREMAIIFPIPDQMKFYKTSPGHYLGHLIGHQGKGSLWSELKAKGWATFLSGGESHGARGFSFFEVSIELSPDGFKNRMEVVKLLFQYLALLTKQGVHEWIFNEYRDLSAIHFRFKEKQWPVSVVTNITSNLQHYPMEECLSGRYLTPNYEPDLICNLLCQLRWDNIILTIIANEVKDERTPMIEHYYGTEYFVSNIPKSFLEELHNFVTLNNKLSLPSPNEFIPTNFELAERQVPV